MNRRASIGLLFLLLLFSCTEYTPKPKGYLRLEPEKARYVKLPVKNLPYTFYISDKVSVEIPEEQNNEWLNLCYKDFDVKIYCSYFPVTKTKLPELTEETFKIIERISKQTKVSAYDNPEQNVYGMLFDLGGNTASPIQFYVTDSLDHFFRGALYYNAVANADSLAPVTRYLREDIVELIQSFSWNN
ncbi:gliding motility protein GldD [Massilibacteroides sp.]|uniref:gliding motility lipoprotein GldD n=1 Tax=Massilibacteroides sp. TaxID=2034766 RepID=UPI00260E7B56|nr:gliding motility protein GldD [Massilibacteroides sp.]MDD4514966.1 gliding motility protein GldD [Massilibacteroides sp.]